MSVHFLVEPVDNSPETPVVFPQVFPQLSCGCHRPSADLSTIPQPLLLRRLFSFKDLEKYQNKESEARNEIHLPETRARGSHQYGRQSRFLKTPDAHPLRHLFENGRRNPRSPSHGLRDRHHRRNPHRTRHARRDRPSRAVSPRSRPPSPR